MRSEEAATQTSRYRRAAAILLLLCIALPLLGLVNVLAALVLDDAAAVDRFENPMLNRGEA